MSDPANPEGYRPTHAYVSGRAWPIRVLGAFGSVKGAALLIGTIAVVIGIGTYYERAYGARAATVMVYRAPWFDLLWAMIALCIFGAAAVRYPWRKRQLGFVVVHVGLLLLVTGFVVGRNRIEGMLRLPLGQSAWLATVDRDVLSVTDSNGTQVAVDFDVTGDGGLPSFARFCLSPLWPLPPRTVHSLAQPAPLISTRRSDRLWSGAIAAPEGFPRVSLRSVCLAGADDLGYALGEAGEPAAVGITLTATPPGGMAQEVGATWLREAGPVTYAVGPLHVSLARSREPRLLADLARSRSELPTVPTLVIYGATVQRIAVPDVLPADHTLADGTQLTISRRIERPLARHDADGAVIGLDDDPGAALDPLVMVELRRGELRQGMVAFALRPAFASVPEWPELLYEHPLLRDGGGPGEQGVEASVVLQGEHALLSWISRTRGRQDAVPLTAGQPWNGDLVGATGGPMRLAARVEHLPHAHPAPRRLQLRGDKEGEAARWIEIEVERGSARGRVWLSRGDPERGQTTLTLDDGSTVTLSYAPLLYDVAKQHGFRLRLDRFEQGRDPGGTSVATYVSHLTLTPASGGSDESLTVAMNEPLVRRGATVSQASFTPELDHDGLPIPGRYEDSVLLVATDPGIWCKWVGSAVLVAGIILIAWLNRRLPVVKS